MRDGQRAMTGADEQPTGGGAEQPGRAAALRRSKDDRVLFGVCGGLGEYLGIDAVIVRLVFVLLVVLGGGGLILYLVALVIMPEEKPGEAVRADGERSQQAVVLAVGGGLVLLGSLMLAQRLLPWVSDLVGPAVLIVVGVAAIALARR